MPLYRQLADGLREAILDGRLPGGSRLPSTRSMADDLDVSRSTVVTAFEQLNAEGYLRSTRGSGTFVPSDLPAAGPGRVSLPDGAVASPLEVPPAQPPPRPFRPGIPALEEFASGGFGRVLRRVWRELDPALLADGDVAGDPVLRTAVARHLRGSRKVRCTPDDVIVTSGSQEALALAFDVLTRPGDPVWVEEPGYIGAHRALRAVGCEAVPVPVDDRGMLVGAGLRERPDARVAYVTPSHHFPTGVTLSLARRLELLEWATGHDRWIVEDDYDSEFRLSGRPLPSLQGLDEGARVVYVGTFSKSLAPGLRLGFLVSPPALRERLIERKRQRIGPTSPWLQRALGHFIDEGHFARHIRRTRLLYRERKAALAGAVRRDLQGLAELREPTGAMHGVLDLAAGIDARTVAAAAEERGIEVIPLSWFSLSEVTAHTALFIGFAAWPPERLEGAVRELGDVVRRTSVWERDP
jgi:GntR family transcriptional regulator/MocR family aminotransferase